MPRLRLRRAEKHPSHDYGAPPRPKGMSYPFRRAWDSLTAELLAARVLRQDDAELLTTMIQARADQYKAAGLRKTDAAAKAEEILSSFMARVPQPEALPVSAGDTTPDTPEIALSRPLVDFLGDCAAMRDSFQIRRQDGATVALDAGRAVYQWPEGDFLTRARDYALARRDDEAGSGISLRRSCARFLNDLETGAGRGLWFDPWAARLTCEFAQAYCGIVLLEWQIFVLINVFGWKKVHGERRFTEAWLSVGKKNGKTVLASVIGLWGLVCDGEKFPDVFAAATKKEQSSIVWRDAKRAVGASPELEAHIKRRAGHLEVEATDGSFTPLSSDEKSLDGLRPSFIIADEVSFWSDREQWDKLIKGTVSRSSPLTFAITTAGKDRNCFAWSKFDLAEKILTGTFSDDGTFVCVFSIDADDDYLNDEACWIKANPSLGVTLKIEHLRKTRDEVLQDGSGRNSFLQYHMNQWVEKALRRQGSITRDKWDRCAGLELVGARNPVEGYDKFIPLNVDVLCYAGLDVGLTNDMTAITYLFDHFIVEAQQKDAGGKIIKDPVYVDNKRVVICEYFMPEDGLLEKERSWRVPLSVWVREGWIKLLPGDMVDTRDITKHILETARVQSITELGFDKWGAQQVGADVNASTAIKCVEVPQLPSQLTNPCREFLADIRRGDIVHFGNPVLAWNVSNIILAEDDRTGGIKPEKLSAIEKIDGCQALMNSYHRMLAAPPRLAGRVVFI